MLQNILGGLLLFPFLILIVCLILSKKIGVSPSRRFGFAVDWTTPFLGVSVTVLIHTIWDQWLGFYVAGTVCILAILFSIVERLQMKEFRTFLVLRKTWRVYFLLLTCAYILLLGIGIALQIIQYAN
ncbi:MULTISPECIES: DUF3397 family protein [Sporosarcina]|uniref:DUF3397 domain-containing protein n=2 Tax=Sporosarcina newyorkensis TaxID=759851 RepID=A0A1T4YFJ6_9BACL|nr:DUF3397 family protein [Sporosarcina newyorkensis]EGQ27292.1 hypothetical protein HMPREF9372_0740 [Sporosarcina newyorkensis 2681]SKB00460.1 Protein of unknown function [Sporosarcina newyorkensis]